MTVFAVLQCGHGSDAVETPGVVPGIDYVLVALQCGHGSDAVETPAHTVRPHDWTCCFNAATAVTPWRLAGRVVYHWTHRGLQCGHGSDAVETATSPG